MPVGSLPSSTTGITVGVAPAYCVVLHRPAAAAQFAAKVQGGLLVFWIVTLPFDGGDDGGVAGLSQLGALEAQVQTRPAPSCSTDRGLPRCDRMSSVVPRTPMVASPW